MLTHDYRVVLMYVHGAEPGIACSIIRYVVCVCVLYVDMCSMCNMYKALLDLYIPCCSYTITFHARLNDVREIQSPFYLGSTPNEKENEMERGKKEKN